MKVQVAVEGHELAEIEITEHQNGLGGKAEEIIEDVIDSQSLEVYAISGATVSSKCILKALEDALRNGTERLDRPGISGTVVGLSERIRKKSIKILFSCNQLLILSEYIVKAVSKAQEKKGSWNFGSGIKY